MIKEPIKKPVISAIQQPVRWGHRVTDPLRALIAVLVDPNDGLALQTPTGEAWVQWMEVAVLVDPNDGLALQAPTGETWVQWITMDNGDEQ